MGRMTEKVEKKNREIMFGNETSDRRRKAEEMKRRREGEGKRGSEGGAKGRERERGCLAQNGLIKKG